MRQTLRLLGVGFLSLLSLETLVSILDWLGRLDWLTAFLASHPHVTIFVHTPFAYLAFLVFGFLFLWAERKLKLPRIVGRYINSRIVPNLSTTPLIAVFETEQTKPGWDERKLDWFWFVEIQLANDSDTQTTIEDIEVRVKTGKLLRRKIAATRYVEDINNYKIQRKGDDDAKGWQRYREIPSLLKNIRGVQLTRGVGYRGWVCCEIRQVDQRDINNRPRIDAWLIDALQGKHKVHHQHKSELRWDTAFEIVKD